MEIKELQIVYNVEYLPYVRVRSTTKVPKKIYNGEDTAKEVYNLLEYIYDIKYQIEENSYVVAFYDSTLLGVYHLSQGTDANCDIDPKAIYRFLLLAGANRYYLVHNHPNCIDEMSQEDYNITKKLQNLDFNFNIHMINHIIVGKDNWRELNYEMSQMAIYNIENVEEYYEAKANGDL